MPFDPNDPFGAPPLDVASIMPPAQAQPEQPPTSKGGKGKGWMANAALAALVPLAARRGGPTAVAAVMRGFQDEMQRGQAYSSQQAQQQFQNQRLLDADKRSVDAQASADQARQQGFQIQQAQQRSSLARNYVNDLRNAQTAEEVSAITGTYQQAASAIGFRPGSLDALAREVASPNALLERRVHGAVKALKPETLDYYMEHRVTLRVGDQDVPFEAWSHYVPYAVDPSTGNPAVRPVKAPTANTPQEQAQERYAKEHGFASWADVPFADQLKVMGEIGAAGRAPSPPARGPSATAFNAAVKEFRDSMLFVARQDTPPQDRIESLRSRAKRLGLNFDEEVDRAARAAQGEAVKGARARDLANGSGVAIPEVSAYTGRFGGSAPPASGRGGRASGAGPVGGGVPAPAPAARTATRGDVQKVADGLGITYAEAEKQLKARGVVVVGQ